VIGRTVRWLDRRTGTAPVVRRTLRYLFPDHWSFLLGEVALYLFILLVATGVYLTFFFEPDTSRVIYHGSYEPLRGASMTHAYKSVVDLSLDVKAGLLIRQTHHWAANLFVAAVVLHLLRVFFTGAFRKPRDLTYWIGLTMLMLAVLEGYIGYSMVDDLLSGMGLAIGYSVALSIPFVGASLGQLIWGGPFPGGPSFWSRLYVAHVLLIPIAIGLLLSVHLALVALRHHTQFRERRAQTERRIVGVPTFPGQAPRSLGLMTGVFGVLFLLGGLVQINPVWLWGPYHVGSSTNGAQPDWYLGWLIGALRLVPGFDVVVGGYTLVPNAFWGGALFPLVVFGILFLWPWAERRKTGDDAFHNLLERPRDNPWRTAIGVALVLWVLLVFMAGALDRSYVYFGITYESQIRVFRVLVVVAPLVALFATKRVCDELLAGERVERVRREAELGPRAAVTRRAAASPAPDDVRPGS
jgi:ubiquinol-cytochrome c reductase cytochrome b subunit